MQKKPDPEKKNPERKKKKLTLRQEFDRIFKSLSWLDMVGVAKETLQDLKKPTEMFTLAAGALVPGGFIVYAAYRVRHYRLGSKPVNDNKKPKNPEPPKSDKPPSP